MGDLSGAYALQCEDIIFAVKGRHILNEGRGTDYLYFARVSNQALYQSHQKPIELLSYLIKKSSNREDVILDCYMGSGSTIISATNLGRKAIGIELNNKFLKSVDERLINECYSQVKGILWKNQNEKEK
jgi:DNA modification methylase